MPRAYDIQHPTAFREGTAVPARLPAGALDSEKRMHSDDSIREVV